MTLQWSVPTLLPHDSGMVLIAEPASFGGNWAQASVRIGEDSLFYNFGHGVPSWVGVEYIAQTIALYAGIDARQKGEDIKIGLLIGCRRYEADTEYFSLGSHLSIHVEESWKDSQMASFECVINVGAEVARANLNVFSPTDGYSFMERQKS